MGPGLSLTANDLEGRQSRGDLTASGGRNWESEFRAFQARSRVIQKRPLPRYCAPHSKLSRFLAATLKRCPLGQLTSTWV
jgi:hypothetical protein